MPFKSEKQRRYLWANEPEIAREWTDRYGAADGGIMRIPFQYGGTENLWNEYHPQYGVTNKGVVDFMSPFFMGLRNTGINPQVFGNPGLWNTGNIQAQDLSPYVGSDPFFNDMDPQNNIKHMLSDPRLLEGGDMATKMFNFNDVMDTLGYTYANDPTGEVFIKDLDEFSQVDRSNPSEMYSYDTKEIYPGVTQHDLNRGLANTIAHELRHNILEQPKYEGILSNYYKKSPLDEYNSEEMINRMLDLKAGQGFEEDQTTMGYIDHIFKNKVSPVDYKSASYYKDLDDVTNQLYNKRLEGVDRVPDSILAGQEGFEKESIWDKIKEGIGTLPNKFGQSWDFTKQLPGMAMSALSGIPGIGLLTSLAQRTNPFNINSPNYSKGLGLQVADLQKAGIIGTDPSTGNPYKIMSGPLAGKNLVSLFGTNDYDKMLDKKIDWFENRIEQGKSISKKRYEEAKKEKERRDAIARQRTKEHEDLMKKHNIQVGSGSDAWEDPSKRNKGGKGAFAEDVTSMKSAGKSYKSASGAVGYSRGR